MNIIALFMLALTSSLLKFSLCMLLLIGSRNTNKAKGFSMTRNAIVVASILFFCFRYYINPCF